MAPKKIAAWAVRLEEVLEGHFWSFNTLEGSLGPSPTPPEDPIEALAMPVPAVTDSVAFPHGFRSIFSSPLSYKRGKRIITFPR